MGQFIPYCTTNLLHMWVNVMMVTIKGKKKLSKDRMCVRVRFTTFSSFLFYLAVNNHIFTEHSLPGLHQPFLHLSDPAFNKYYILSVISVWSRTARPPASRHWGSWARKEWDGGAQEHWLAVMNFFPPQPRIKSQVEEREANKDSNHRKTKQKHKDNKKQRTKVKQKQVSNQSYKHTRFILSLYVSLLLLP